MARTSIPCTTLAANGGVTLPAGTAVASGAGNGGRVAGADIRRTILWVANASGGPGTATILAGVNPPSIAAGQGNLAAQTVADGASAYLGPFDSSRVTQADGSLIVETSVAMTVTAFQTPRGV